MIGKLRGHLDSITSEGVILDVGGVGYLVHVSGRTLGALPPVGESASLLIETHVREDHIHLYGFAEAGERDWFRLLETVQGVGVRHALAILSVLTPGDLTQAVAAQDKRALARASGVGPKLAGRIVAELKDKVGDMALGQAVAEGAGGAPAGAAARAGAEGAAGSGTAAVSEDAVSALVNLGYGRSEAFSAVAAAARRLGDGAEVSALIKEGLKELAQ
jgi:Holliday junction DNA helicase RuvA